MELIGISAPFDIHRQTVTQPQVSMTNLLPGTIYSIRSAFLISYEVKTKMHFVAESVQSIETEMWALGVQRHWR